MRPIAACQMAALTIQATGSNLEYSIDGGSTYSSSPVFSDLAPGSYSVVIRNANQPSCTATYPSNPILIQGPSLPTITDIANKDLSACEHADGSLTISATGTSLEYSLDGNTYQGSNQFTNLSAGTYTVYVRETGSSTCVASESISLSLPIDCQPEDCETSDNLALAGTASQSSTHGDGVASLAIDGNLEGDDNWGDDANLQHTKSLANPWWKVDLGQVSKLDSIVIINRTSTSAFLLGRLREFYLLSSPIDFDPSQSIAFPNEQSRYQLDLLSR